jgi:hypothetical protein
MCRVVDTVLVDQETIYAPRHGNDRLLLGLKGSLNEYELDLLRQRSLSARYEKARRGELVVAAPVGFVKAAPIFPDSTDRNHSFTPDPRRAPPSLRPGLSFRYTHRSFPIAFSGHMGPPINQKQVVVVPFLVQETGHLATGHSG